MKTDKVSQLVHEARSIFSTTSVSQIIGLDRSTAVEILNKKYNNPDRKSIDRYLEVVERLRW